MIVRVTGGPVPRPEGIRSGSFVIVNGGGRMLLVTWNVVAIASSPFPYTG